MTTDFSPLTEISQKLLKLRLPFYPNYGFLYIVSCDHWVFENSGRKCYKFGITSQSLLKRCHFYDIGKFGNLTLFSCYPCTNAKRVEDLVKTKVEPYVKKGKEWVDLDLEALKGIIESVIEKDPYLQNDFQLIEYRITPLRKKEDDDETDIDMRDLRLTGKGFLTVKPDVTFATPVTKHILSQKVVSERLKTHKNIRYDALRRCFVAYAQHKYSRASKTFSLDHFATEDIAFQKAVEWQQTAVSEMKRTNLDAKRTFSLSPELEEKVKSQRGLRIDKHNGVFIVFVQKQKVALRKMFSYRDAPGEKALEAALAFRQKLLDTPPDKFPHLARKRKRRTSSKSSGERGALELTSISRTNE